MNFRQLSILALLVGMATSATAGQVFSWTDAQGKKHFSDTPPKGVEAKPMKLDDMSVVKIPDAPPPPPAASEATSSLPPECQPGYSGDKTCTRAAGAGKGVQENGGGQAATSKENPSIRSGPLETIDQQIKGYSKSERVKQIEERNKAVKSYSEGEPKTVNQKLMERYHKSQSGQ